MIDMIRRAVELAILHWVGPPILDDPWWLHKLRWWSYPEYSFIKQHMRHMMSRPPAPPLPIRSQRFYRVGRKRVWWCETVYASPLRPYQEEAIRVMSKGERVRANVDAYLFTFESGIGKTRNHLN